MKPSLPSPLFTLQFLLSAIYFLLSPLACSSATVTGTLSDISLQALNTKLTFAPTNDVLLTPAGLSAGPPRTIATTNGEFSIVLEAGDYTVSLPLVPWRKAFAISVFATNGTVNITNLLAPPHTYTYTNTFLTWLRIGDDISYSAGKVGIGLANPGAPLEVKFDSGGDTPKQLLLSSADTATAVGLELKSPNSAHNWQLGLFNDVFKIGKFSIGDYLTIGSDGALSAISLALLSGNASLNEDGSASFANGAAHIGDDGSAYFAGGLVAINDTPLLHLQNNSTAGSPEQLLIESTDTGAVGLQFKSPGSTNNWQTFLSDDSFKIGKAGFTDFLTLNSAGRLNAPFGYAVGASIGMTTNLLVVTPGPKTNTLIFTKGILTNVQ